jgi:hypothetical protein
MRTPRAPLLGAAALAAVVRAGAPANAGADTGIAVYVLSRGAGVPEATREAARRIRSLIETARSEGRAIRVEEKPIGLEGETRLCADARDAAAKRELLDAVRDAAAQAELLDVVEEPCSP